MLHVIFLPFTWFLFLTDYYSIGLVSSVVIQLHMLTNCLQYIYILSSSNQLNLISQEMTITIIARAIWPRNFLVGYKGRSFFFSFFFLKISCIFVTHFSQTTTSNVFWKVAKGMCGIRSTLRCVIGNKEFVFVSVS